MKKLKRVQQFTSELLLCLPEMSAEIGRYEYGNMPKGEGNGAYPVILKTRDGERGLKVLLTPHVLYDKNWDVYARMIGGQMQDAIKEVDMV